MAQQAAATKEMDLSYVMETVDDNTPEPTTTDEGDDDDKVEAWMKDNRLGY